MGIFHYRTWIVYSNDGLSQNALGHHEQASWMHTVGDITIGRNPARSSQVNSIRLEAREDIRMVETMIPPQDGMRLRTKNKKKRKKRGHKKEKRPK